MVELNYPSIRNCVITLQDIKTQNKHVVMDTIKPFNDVFNKYYNALINDKNWRVVKEAIIKNNVDVRALNMFLWEKAVETDNIRLIQISCKNERDMALGANDMVVIVTSLIDMVK